MSYPINRGVDARSRGRAGGYAPIARVLGHESLWRHRRHGARLAGLLVATALLGACGFQLRGVVGSSALPESWRSLHLSTASPNTEFARTLDASFSANGVVWAPRDEANYELRLGPERFSQRNLSVNAQARAAEFDLVMSADFSVVDSSGKLVMPQTTATVNKQMENDPQNVVGKAEEVRILRTELRRELADQILRRMSFFAANTQ
ncbi:MAG: LPS assembly lipoprotein LptE [Halieaceae bacterium]|nr:LPS assembly lipoprotein LptE [Halieaceae bacterium]